MQKLLTAVLSAFLLALSLAANEQTTPPEAEIATGDYLIEPLDLIKIQIYQEPDLNRDVRVTQEGAVSLPLIGELRVAGKTVRRVEETIRKLYDDNFLVNPQVTVAVIEYSRKTVQVLGAVSNAGAIPFQPEQPMDVIEAVAKAGGFTRLANRKQVRLTRMGEDGAIKNFIIDMDALIQGSKNESWMLRKGDVVYVPERIL